MASGCEYLWLLHWKEKWLKYSLCHLCIPFHRTYNETERDKLIHILLSNAFLWVTTSAIHHFSPNVCDILRVHSIFQWAYHISSLLGELSDSESSPERELVASESSLLWKLHATESLNCNLTVSQLSGENYLPASEISGGNYTQMSHVSRENYMQSGRC